MILSAVNMCAGLTIYNLLLIYRQITWPLTSAYTKNSVGSFADVIHNSLTIQLIN